MNIYQVQAVIGRGVNEIVVWAFQDLKRRNICYDRSWLVLTISSELIDPFSTIDPLGSNIRDYETYFSIVTLGRKGKERIEIEKENKLLKIKEFIESNHSNEIFRTSDVMKYLSNLANVETEIS